jgi:hypothetical protein
MLLSKFSLFVFYWPRSFSLSTRRAMRDSSRFLDFAWSNCTDASPSPLAGNLTGLRIACPTFAVDSWPTSDARDAPLA